MGPFQNGSLGCNELTFKHTHTKFWATLKTFPSFPFIKLLISSRLVLHYKSSSLYFCCCIFRDATGAFEWIVFFFVKQHNDLKWILQSLVLQLLEENLGKTGYLFCLAGGSLESEGRILAILFYSFNLKISSSII